MVSKASPSEDRVYSSRRPVEQRKFPSRSTRVNTRHSLGSTKPLRQETLTQMPFVSTQKSEKEHMKDIEAFEESMDNTRSKKRRRTEGDESNLKHYTQTLTQFDFSSTPILTDNDFDDLESDGISLPPRARTYGKHVVPRQVQRSTKLNNSSIENAVSSHMPTPVTPRKPVYEIPSSQSPSTPFSVLSSMPRSQISPSRPPLAPRSTNEQGVVQSPLGVKKKPQRENPVLTVEDTFETNSSDWTCSSPKTVRFADHPVISFQYGTTTTDTHLVPNMARSIIKQEIEDSDAESDDNMVLPHEAIGAKTQTEAQDGTGQPEQPTTEDEEQQILSLPNLPSRYINADSQRLSTQHFDLMAPRTETSDIFISIHPSNVEKIVLGYKNHEFRSYKFPPQVVRVWIYETRPSSSVRYMASIGPVKTPGEIVDTQGFGNAEFNIGKGSSRYAYEILQLYELAEPVSLERLKARHWPESAPQKYTWVRPAVLGDLMANLMHPIFEVPLAEEEPGSDSQDVAAQLLHDMAQVTNSDVMSSCTASGPRRKEKYARTPSPEVQYSPDFECRLLVEDQIPTPIGSSESKFIEALDLLSTQQDSYRDAVVSKSIDDGDQRPSQATTVDLSQSPRRLDRMPPSTLEIMVWRIAQKNALLPASGDSIPKSPERCRIARSNQKSQKSPLLPKAMRRESWADDSHAPSSLMSSSQILTRSQMLPDSLLNDDIPAPPLAFVADSDEDEEDL